jgi:hypothetical protein
MREQAPGSGILLTASCRSARIAARVKERRGQAKAGSPPLSLEGRTMPREVDAEKARHNDIVKGESILRRPWQRAVFLAGLFACVALLFLALLVRF